MGGALVMAASELKDWLEIAAFLASTGMTAVGVITGAVLLANQIKGLAEAVKELKGTVAEIQTNHGQRIAAIEGQLRVGACHE